LIHSKLPVPIKVSISEAWDSALTQNLRHAADTRLLHEVGLWQGFPDGLVLFRADHGHSEVILPKNSAYGAAKPHEGCGVGGI